MVKVSIFILGLWHKISEPLFGARCRFHPSCSVYAKEALEKYGFFKGWYLALKRLIRCQPFCEGGLDPVP